jgi:hypothetical protein
MCRRSALNENVRGGALMAGRNGTRRSQTAQAAFANPAGEGDGATGRRSTMTPLEVFLEQLA